MITEFMCVKYVYSNMLSKLFSQICSNLKVSGFGFHNPKATGSSKKSFETNTHNNAHFPNISGERKLFIESEASFFY